MIATNKSVFEYKMESLIKRCKIKAYCYSILGGVIAFNAIAIQGYVIYNLLTKKELYIISNNPSFWILATSLLMSVFAINWTQQQKKLADEERLGWEKAIFYYHQSKNLSN